MSITVRDCLKLSSLSFGKVVAGKNGLDRIVSSVSVLEFFNTDELDVFTPNELIISALHDIKDDVEKQCEAIKDLSNTGAVALIIFYVGKVLPSINKKVITLADKLDFPIISMQNKSYNIKYSDVISDVMSSVLHDQIISEDFVSITHKRLSQLPLELRTMENLLSIMSNHYKCNLLLAGASNIYFQSTYRPSAFEESPDFYFENFNDVPAGFCSKEVIVDDVTINLYKADFSIVESTYMTLYACCRNTHLTEKILNDMCICTRFFSTTWGYSINLNSPETLLSLILKTDSNAARHYIRSKNIDFSDISNLIAVSPGSGDIMTLKEDLRNIFEDYRKKYLVDIIDGQIVFVSNITLSDSLDENLFNDLYRYVEHYDPGASFFMDMGSSSIESLKNVYKNYRKSFPVLKKIFINRRNWDTHDIMLSQEIISLSETGGKKTEYLHSIIDTLKNDRDDLLTTLSVYLIDCNSHLKQTADTLFLHRNTISYRLNKIKELTNTDFTLMPACYDFFLAMAFWRFQNMS